MEQVNLVAANQDFETDFRLDPSGTLQNKTKAQVNRDKITAERISSTSFKAVLSRVQYGTYEKNRAVLVVFEFSFGYQKNSHHRIQYASINIEFTKTSDARFTPPSPYEPNDDPIVKKILPVQVLRKPTETGEGGVSSFSGTPRIMALIFIFKKDGNQSQNSSIQSRLAMICWLKPTLIVTMTTKWTIISNLGFWRLNL